MIKPIITAEEAVQMVQSGDTLVIGGSGAGHAIPESLIEALGKRFRHGGSGGARLGTPRRPTPD